MIARLAQIGLLSALLAGASPVWAQPGGLAPGQPAEPLGLDRGIARRLAELPADIHRRGVTVGLDAALYDQRASETLSGASNLTMLAWQFAGTWRPRQPSRWGSGALAWTLLGSQDIGNAGNETLSSNVGSISGLNANAVSNPVAIDELYWRHDAPDKAWRLLVGRIDQSAHFDTNAVANDGYAQFFAFALENNPSIPWPTYGGLGGVLRAELGAGRYLLASAAVVGDDPRITWSAAGHDGWNQMLEIGSALGLAHLGRGHVRLTAWHSRIPGANGFGLALNLDQELGRWPPGDRGQDRRPSGSQLIGFFRAGIGEPTVAPVQRFVSGGVALRAPFARAHDRIGLGVAWSDPSPGAGERSETLIEAYYRLAFSPRLSLTSDLQLVIDPAVDAAARNTAVLGLRLHLRL